MSLNVSLMYQLVPGIFETHHFMLVGNKGIKTASIGTLKEICVSKMISCGHF